MKEQFGSMTQPFCDLEIFLFCELGESIRLPVCNFDEVKVQVEASHCLLEASFFFYFFPELVLLVHAESSHCLFANLDDVYPNLCNQCFRQEVL